MKFTPRSITFIAILVTVVVFFGGLNLGKRIQGIDNATPIVVTATPSPSPTGPQPTPTSPSITFTTFDFEECGVSFLLPSNMTENTTENDEVEFVNGNERIFITCNASYINSLDGIFENFEASESAVINNDDETIYTNEGSRYWLTRNSDRRQVFVEVSEPLFPLIQSSLAIK